MPKKKTITAYVNFEGLTLTNGTASSSIAAQSDTNPDGSLTVTVADDTGFSVSDEVWCINPDEPEVGEYNWAITGADGFYAFQPTPDAPYRNLNVWLEQVLLLAALGSTRA